MSRSVPKAPYLYYNQLLGKCYSGRPFSPEYYKVEFSKDNPIRKETVLVIALGPDYGYLFLEFQERRFIEELKIKIWVQKEEGSYLEVRKTEEEARKIWRTAINLGLHL
jgi:hypothetical protein